MFESDTLVGLGSKFIILRNSISCNLFTEVERLGVKGKDLLHTLFFLRFHEGYYEVYCISRTLRLDLLLYDLLPFLLFFPFYVVRLLGVYS